MKDPQYPQPPFVAQKVISLCLPNTVKHEILGDMEEEFNQQFILFGNKKAKYFYWKQAIVSIFQFTAIRANNSLSSSNLKQKLSLVLGGAVFLISLLLIAWLSHIEGFDGFSNNIEAELAQGNLHKALTQAQFWQTSILNLKHTFNLGTYFQFEAFVWAAFAIFFINYINNRHFISATNTIFLLYFMTLLPYLVGSIYLEFSYLSIQQAGPLLAKIIFSIFYLILPTTFLAYISLSKRNQYE